MGYLELLRAHPHFRRLWLADVASLFGDWLNTLAIYALVRAIPRGHVMTYGQIATLIENRLSPRNEASLSTNATQTSWMMSSASGALPVILNATR